MQWLLALMRSRLVEQEPVSRRYHLGEEAFVLGVLASRRYGLLDVAMESLIAQSARSGDTSFLSVRRDAFAVCLHREEGAYPIRTHALEVGDRHPLGVGGGSLAILATLPDAEIERVLAGLSGRPQARLEAARWRLFFLACAELFGYRNGEEWLVSHYVLSPSSRGVAR